MFFQSKAYLNTKGGGVVLNLTHDVKRCLLDAKAPKGLVNIVSNQATTAVTLLENDPNVQKGVIETIQNLFAGGTDNQVARRSGSGSDRYHLMAAMTGLSLTLPFDNGKLATSAFYEIVALDYDAKPGRREFLITVLGDTPPAGK
jgi:secondary thiamine-phosphate synthase enzyme